MTGLWIDLEVVGLLEPLEVLILRALVSLLDLPDLGKEASIREVSWLVELLALLLEIHELRQVPFALEVHLREGQDDAGPVRPHLTRPVADASRGVEFERLLHRKGPRLRRLLALGDDRIVEGSRNHAQFEFKLD